MASSDGRTSITPMNVGSAPSTGRRRVDVKAIMATHLRPYAIVKDWREEFEIHKEHRTHFARDVNGKVMALRDDCDWNSRAETLVLALDLRDALPTVAVIAEAEAMILAALQAPFDEPSATLLISMMLDAMPAKPGEGAAVYLDAMVFTLEELRLDGEDDLAVPTAAIAAALQDVWKEKTFRPAHQRDRRIRPEALAQARGGPARRRRVERFRRDPGRTGPGPNRAAPRRVRRWRHPVLRDRAGRPPAQQVRRNTHA